MTEVFTAHAIAPRGDVCDCHAAGVLNDPSAASLARNRAGWQAFEVVGGVRHGEVTGV